MTALNWFDEVHGIPVVKNRKDRPAQELGGFGLFWAQ